MKIKIDRYGEVSTAEDKKPGGSCHIRYIHKDLEYSTDKLVKLVFREKDGTEKKYKIRAAELSVLENPTRGLALSDSIPDYIMICL